MVVKFIISIIAVSVAAIRVWCPSLQIDMTTIVLLIIATLPWLSQIFSSVELPGGWKFVFRELQKAGERAVQAGMIPQTLTEQEEQRYSFQLIGSEDPNLALAGLRIEIEKRLKTLAERHDIGTRMQGIGSLLNALSRREILSQQERSIIADMIGLLNQAVHGAKVDNEAAQWAMEFGPKLLKSLDERIGDNEHM